MVSKDDKPSKAESHLRASPEDEKPSTSELQQLQDLYALMVSEGLDVIEVKQDDVRIKLSRRPSGVVVHSPGHSASGHSGAPARAAAPAAEAEIPSNLQPIQTPLAGVFYRASSPTSAPFAKEGDVAEPGQTLCIVEAMKVMNEIKAESRCRIVRIVAENSRPVATGQTLFLVEPA